MFIKGRIIFKNICLTQEMIHCINKPAHGGNIILKIDLAKAYDGVHWEFLFHVLASFGFSDMACGLLC